MRDIRVVFGYTLRENARKKAFKISTAIGLLLILILCLLPSVIGAFGSRGGAEGGQPGAEVPAKRVCYFIGDGVIPNAMDALAAENKGVEFRSAELSDLEELKAEVETADSVSVLVLESRGGEPFLTGYNKDFMHGISVQNAAATLKRAYVENLLEGQNVDPSLADRLLSDMGFAERAVGKMDLSGYIVGIVLTLLMFFAIYYYGYGVAMSVATEKTSRVMETLIVSTKPGRLLVGKCLAMGTLGLLQLSVFIAAAAVGYKLLIPPDTLIMGMPLALSSFTPASAALILVYFLLGYFLYAVLYSVCGAMVSRMEDISPAMMPVMLVTMLSFYLAYFSLLGGGAALKKIVTLVPFTSPFTLPFRLLNEQVAPADIVVSVLLLALAIAGVTALSVKLYSASVLHYGDRLKLKDLKNLRDRV